LAGLRTIGLTGRDGGQLGRLSQLEINVADPHMGRIEDGHMIVAHMLCYYFMDQEKPGGASPVHPAGVSTILPTPSE
jgi:hypothetical protein